MLRTLDKRQKGGTQDVSNSIPTNKNQDPMSKSGKLMTVTGNSSQAVKPLDATTPPKDCLPNRTLNARQQTTRNKTSANGGADKSGLVKFSTVPAQETTASMSLESNSNRKKHVELKSEAPPDYGREVWVTDSIEGFRAARIVDISKTGFSLALISTDEPVSRRYEEVFSSEEDPKKSVEDTCSLLHLNEATLLNNCRLRYMNGKIYSYVANILISINPYQLVDGFYSLQKIKEYRGKSLGQKEPHIYAIADKSYREMRRNKKSQSIIVAGESGAGKTESQKAVLQYLCENWGGDVRHIQQRLLETNPILEAFGNAKTLRNNNSSRFGKFVQIHFANNGTVAGGFISHYLLETSRVCRQSPGERNYHIFYQLIAGSSPELYKHLKLDKPNFFTYLKNGFTGFFANLDSQSPSKILKKRFSNTSFSYDSMVDDFNGFQRLEAALRMSGLNEQEIMFVWSTIAGVLHLGNVEFDDIIDDSKGGCKIAKNSEDAVMQSAALLGLQAIELKLGLCARIMQTTKGGLRGTLIRVPLKSHEASAGRDALAKAIYSKLFDWVVLRINQSIPFDKSTNFVGVLDVAGFEYYAVNSFEQFCINYCNEKLQHFFNERILKEEQNLYEKEGLNIGRIEFIDNTDCIELFETKGIGLLDLLDEEARLPTQVFKNFTKRAHEENRKNFRLDTPRKSKVKIHREMRDDEGLLIRHYAGSVCYETKNFIEKNNDQLYNSLEILIEQSTFPLLVSLFTSSSSGPSKTNNKLKTQSVGSKFKLQLSTLIEKLQSTGTHFVRCIKPNNKMIPWHFEGSVVLTQLQCAGMASVLKLMQNGFPSRTSFGALYSTYQSNLPPKLASMEPRLFSKCLFRALGLDHHDFQFGLTRVFFKAGKFSEFDRMMRQDPESIESLITKVNYWLVKGRWKQAQYAVWSVIKMKNKIAYRVAHVVKLQSIMRGFISRQQFSPQIDLYRKLCFLLKNSKEIERILSRLNESSRNKWENSAKAIIQELEKLVWHIKLAEKYQVGKAESAYEIYVTRVDSIILDLKKQQRDDELEVLERKRRETEKKEKREREMRLREDEEKTRQKTMEEQQAKAQRRLEHRLIEEIRKSAAEREETQQKDQQMRLDEIASDLLEDCDGVTLVKTTKSETSSGSSTMKVHDQYDLANWKYAELRDAINNSMDINLLVACEEEFRRRLRIYNEWKSRNYVKRDGPTSMSVPLSVFRDAESSVQRCFKYAFDTGKEGGKQGMFYAHFSGDHIQRQLTLRPSQMPQLMMTGHDDHQMCLLTLRETGLDQKSGAEIPIAEFERQWNMAGGVS